MSAEKLVVRSSAGREDGRASSCAGAFLSLLDIPGGSEAAIRDAIAQVLASYGEVQSEDQVLIQPQLSDVCLFGVLFSRDLTTLGPYRVLSYDRSGSTTSATGAGGGDLQTYVRARGCQEPYPSLELELVFRAAKEVEALLGDRIEVEVAVDSDQRVCLFQARPLTSAGLPAVAGASALPWLEKVKKKLAKLSSPHPQLCGTHSVFGVMPDWNPAEIIGLRPRALALTLYKELVTDSVWAYMRHNYGYRNLRSFPLMVSLLGAPYIDVRVSFNSFVPRRLRRPLAEKLVNHYVEALVERPQSHDKIEFDIVFSCYYPGIRDDTQRLAAKGFSGEEIGELLSELRHLTNSIVHPSRGLFLEDLARIETLRARHAEVVGSSMSPVDKFYWLIENTKRYGTLPFSGLARAGFVAVQFLNGLVKTKVFSPEDLQSFLGSLNTVANGLARDLALLSRGDISKREFLAEYGHLRPGTYDILSRRYDEDFERYFGGLEDRGAPGPTKPFELRLAQEEAISTFLREEGFDATVSEILNFVRIGIEGREHAKLVFTRSLSAALVELEKIGARCGIAREDLAHLDVKTVLSLYSSLDAEDLETILRRDIEAKRKAYLVTQLARLPELIVRPEDVLHFHLSPSEPNFVTLSRVVGEVVRIDDLDSGAQPRDLSRAVVFARSADPGYDWLFARGIGGIITQWGGANSHMAIRSAELGIPAVIGCGEQNYQEWSRGGQIEVDCRARTVRVLH